MATDNRIDFDLVGIAEQLKDKRLAVPIYQRSYSWKKDQVVEFHDDLRLAFSKSESEYFIGTIVLTRTGPEGRFQIIDGQQRLATTTMLLAAFRDAYKAKSDANRAGIVQSTFLSTADLRTGMQEAKLRLNSEDDKFFFDCVIDASTIPVPSRGSHDLIADARKALLDFVNIVVSDAGAEWLDRVVEWIEFLEHRVRVIALEVPTEADAFLIFETLNDRGADLTIADLLKNYLFGKAGMRLDVVRDGWMQALGALEMTAENATFTTFLKHYWSSRRGTTRERDLFRNIKEHVSNETHAVDFIEELQKAARHYAALLNSDHEFWQSLGSSAKANVESLLRLDLEQNRPLMLAAMQHFSAGELKLFLKAMVSWGVRGLIVGGIGGGVAERVYCEAAVKIRKGEVNDTATLFAELVRIIPSDEEFKAAFAVARVPKGSLARYYLIVLEESLKPNDEPELVTNANEEQVNLEHVLPKAATETDWGAEFSPEERKDWVHRIGNMTLLSKTPNGRIGNKAFSIKAPILKASELVLTKEVGNESTWSPERIRLRQVRLAEQAVKAWPRQP